MDDYRRKKSDTIALFLIITIILILIITLSVGLLFKSEEKIKVLFKKGSTISTLFGGIDEQNNIIGSFVFLFNTKTNKSTSINILPETLISFKNQHVILKEALKRGFSYENLVNAISNLLGSKVEYYIFINKTGFIKLIDLYEGVEIYTKKIKIPEKEIYIPEGTITLDGDKAVEYLSFLHEDTLDAKYDQLKRIENFFASLLKVKTDIFSQLNKKIIKEYILNNLITNFTLSDFLIIHHEILKRRKNNIDFSLSLKNVIVYCDPKRIENNIVYLPKNGGEWIKKEVNESIEYITGIKSEIHAKDKLIIEILNGTDIVGLGIRTKNYLESFGIQVIKVDNADSNDYDNTVVIIYGYDSIGKKLAELINCHRVVIDDPHPDKKIDATLIIGRDFDGKRVR